MLNNSTDIQLTHYMHLLEKLFLVLVDSSFHNLVSKHNDDNELDRCEYITTVSICSDI